MAIVWLVGKSGLLSLELQALLIESEISFIVTGRDDIDYFDESGISRLIQNNDIHWIVNCSAFTDVDKCEAQRELAFTVNAKLPEALARISKSHSLRMIHISTDYVFGSSDYQEFGEDDDKKPLNFYGYTKACGEDLVIKNANDYLILRTSWLYGHKKPSFITDRFQDLHASVPISLISDNFGAPTNVSLLARNIVSFVLDCEAVGVYHVNSLGFTSWYGFAKYAAEIQFPQASINAISSNVISRVARRPVWSILGHTKRSPSGNPQLSTWQIGLREYLDENL